MHHERAMVACSLVRCGGSLVLVYGRYTLAEQPGALLIGNKSMAMQNSSPKTYFLQRHV